MVRRLEGKVAVVTGGAQGIGEGIVRRLVEEGARVAIADRNRQTAEALAATLRDARHEVIAVQVDVAERSEVKAMVAATVAAFGGIDVMFNNAGFNKPLPFFDVDEDNFNAIMRVNTLAVLICMQEAGRQMIAQGRGGKIINTASIAGRQGYPEFAPYCASKAAVISLTQVGAREMAKHKITVNGFSPGVVLTPLWDELERDMIAKGMIKQKGEFLESFSAGILLGHTSMPSDLVGLAAFLASSDSDYMTGQVITCDGGMILT